MAAPLLEVDGLGVQLGPAALLRAASLVVRPGVVHALVGESGSGKTTLARAVLGLLPDGATVTGRLVLDGHPLPPRPGPAWAALRGPTVALVPQDALASLNPVLTLGAQLRELLAAHRPQEARDEVAVELLAAVGLTEPRALLGRYPHQLSGGMRQRALIAAALAPGARLLLADEPTTALDAALRVQVVELLRRLSRERGLGVLLISHDLVAVRRAADEVTVLYAGQVVEQGAVEVLARPRHRYTRALLDASPGPAGFRPLEGLPPAPTEPLTGCPFAPRCSQASAACLAPVPLVDGVACLHPVESSP